MKIKIHFLTSFLCLFCCGLAAQNIKVTGIVSDELAGYPLPGVTIINQANQGQGTSTDIDGKYTLEVPRNTTLAFSYIGYLTQKFTIKNDTILNVALGEDVQKFDEVVVVGYGTQKRSEINGAVSVVLSDDISKTANLRVEQAIQGRTSGIQITQSSGSPGNGLSVRVRGIGTPLNSDPLYIVDGVWVDGIDYLNPNDIETISVLKDAASVAIYGTSGANGVVLITTKEGKKGKKGSVSIDSYYGIQNPAKTVDLLDAEQYATLLLEADPSNSFDLLDPSIYGVGTDWQNAIFEQAPMQSHQVSVLGSSEKSTYGVMGSYFQQDGIVGGAKSGYERYTARFKGTNEVSKRLKVFTNVNFTNFTRDALPENSEFASPVAFALNIDPITSITKDDGTYDFSRIVVGDVKNPVNRIAVTNSTWTNNRLIGALAGELEIIKGLKFKSSGSMDLSDARNFGFLPSYDLDPTGAFVHERIDQNSVSKEFHRWTNLLLENTLNYQFKIGEDHSFDFLVGNTYRDRKYDFTFIGLANLPSNDIEDAYITNQTVNEDNMDNRGIAENITESTLLSYFGRVNYNFLDKYFIAASLRRDGSSRFGANNKFATFPSVSLGWLMSKDIDFKSFFPSLNYLKLRASWGQNGNEASLGDYGFTTIINSVNYVFGEDQTIVEGEAPTTPSNSDLKWEVSTQTNIGFDAGFLEDKLTFAADFFIKETSDLLIPASILATAGSGINASDPPFQNVGTMTNTGWEFSLGYKTGRVLKVDIGGNISFIKNEVTSLGDATAPIPSGFNQGLGGNTTRMEVGQPFGYFYGYQTDGIFQNTFEVKEHVNEDGALLQPNAVPGDFRFTDINGDGLLTDADQTSLGSPYPDFIYGFTSTFEFKGFDLNFFIQGSQGNEIVNATTRYDLRVSNLQQRRWDRWTEENPSETEPRVGLTDINGNFRFSDYFVEDGSFLRLKTLQLGYTLPTALTKKAFINKVRFYVSAQNLFTFTRYTGLDPEIGKRNSFDNSIAANLDYGIDRGLYPQAKIFIGGINLQF